MKFFGVFIALLFSTFLQAQTITTIAGNGTSGFSGEGGPAINAAFSGLCGVAVDKHGNIYIAQWVNNVIQKIDTNGILTRFAGTGVSGLGGDGGSATNAQLELSLDVGIVADNIGNIYFGDGSRVRKVDISGIISTVAGNGSYGYSGDNGPATAAEFEEITGLCFDQAGNLYISDDQISNIRKVNTSGIISTFAGTTVGYSGDGGPATNAQMKSPEGIACDDSGNIYFADLDVGRVRKINSAGIITSIAGGDTMPDFTCEGCPADDLELNGPIGMAVDHSGNAYTSVIVNGTVQKIMKDGLIYTIAGTGASGYSGDGGPASTAMLDAPKMICFDNSGNLLITDGGNHRLRKIWMNTNYVPPVSVPVGQFLVYPNPVTNENFTCKITTDTNEEASITITNILGQQVFSSTCTTNTATNFSINAPPGIYFITATTKESKMNKKLVVD